MSPENVPNILIDSKFGINRSSKFGKIQNFTFKFEASLITRVLTRRAFLLTPSPSLPVP